MEDKDPWCCQRMAHSSLSLVRGGRTHSALGAIGGDRHVNMALLNQHLDYLAERELIQFNNDSEYRYFRCWYGQLLCKLSPCCGCPSFDLLGLHNSS